MNTVSFSLHNVYVSQVMKVTKDYLILYKPPKMHSVPGKGDNIVDWCAEKFPEVFRFKGRGEGEGGLLHRLDYETQGLLLAAANKTAFEKLFDCQNQNKIIKEYSAISTLNAELPEGFPPSKNEPDSIESFFRPYGPGRKQVRPVPADLAVGKKPDIAGDHGNPYRTVVIEKRAVTLSGADGLFFFRLRLYRGFRHQIRCHLAWEGFPILNDPVYGKPADATKNNDSYLALRADSLRFPDPSSGEELHFCLPPLIDEAGGSPDSLFRRPDKRNLFQEQEAP